MKSLAMALESIWHNKVRSLLTMLGIIIGVAAVIILVSVTDGITGMITDIFEEFGTNTIQVSITSRGNTRKISPEQMYEFKERNEEYFNTLDDLKQINGKVVFVRADLNVPAKDGKVTDTTRIDRFVPTMNELADKGAKVVVASHFGRPDGEKKPEFSLAFIAPELEKASGKKVTFIDDCIGDKVQTAIANIKTATSFCWKTCGSTRAKKKMMLLFAKSWPKTLIFM